jgi:anti-sigma-K factor RskA
VSLARLLGERKAGRDFELWIIQDDNDPRLHGRFQLPRRPRSG